MQDDPIAAFVAHLEHALEDGTFARLVLAKPRAATDGLRVSVRRVALKGVAHLSFVHTHATRDLTKNLPLAEGVQQVRALIGRAFGHVHLHAANATWQLMVSQKGRATLLRGKAGPPAAAGSGAHTDTNTETSTEAEPLDPAAPATHDREKHRFLDLDRAFLAELGVTKPAHPGAPTQLVPAMARKWKQINKFIEVLDRALAATSLKTAPKLDVVDFGSGKGYLTFAMHDYLRHTLGLPAQVAGVELRADMVELCNGAVQRLALSGLRFEQGDVRSAPARPIDIMIALHACDTATDFALHTGVRAGATVIMCSPCCHKELRPQLLSPHPLRPILKHGVHLGQQAEMLTDSLRAMLLEACGYETQVFEFVSLEHTSKNKMILAVKRAAGVPATDAWQQIDDIKAYYGIRDQCLETLLRADRA
ncbi:MAG: SAM-dependent methyltransferase [Burkholderiales bacterium]|nr:SAM-dependent methyltransferase [Burkholderiales bacterium]